METTDGMTTENGTILLEPFGEHQARGSIADWTFAQLWRRIVAGGLAPGSRVTEEGLADELQVSRTPLREALRRLEEIGVIVRRRNRSLRVAPLSVEEMVELTMIREALEGLVAREAARRVGAGEVGVESLEGLLEQMAALQDSRHAAAFLQLGDAFHVGIRELSGCVRAAAMLARVQLSLERYRYLIGRDQERLSEIVAEHRAILETIASGDPAAAEASMCAHIAAARRVYERRLQPMLAAGRAAE